MGQNSRNARGCKKPPRIIKILITCDARKQRTSWINYYQNHDTQQQKFKEIKASKKHIIPHQGERKSKTDDDVYRNANFIVMPSPHSRNTHQKCSQIV